MIILAYSFGYTEIQDYYVRKLFWYQPKYDILLSWQNIMMHIFTFVHDNVTIKAAFNALHNLSKLWSGTK